MPIRSSPSARGAAVLAAFALVACGRAAQTGSPTPQSQPLSPYLSQRLIVTPLSRVRVDTMGWVQRLGGARATGRRVDSLVARTFADRAIGRDWFMPADLSRAYERNRSYAADPHNLATDPLRAPSFVALSRYGEPLASQLRTMIALHESARFVLLPVEVRFERENTGATRAILRAVVLDARAAEARWVGDVRSEISTDPGRALESVVAVLANHFIAP